VGSIAVGENGGGQAVDLTDSSLTRQLATPGVLVSVARPSGAIVQATQRRTGAGLLPAGMRRACLTGGTATMRQSSPALALACERVGSVRAPLATVTVGVPLQDSLASLATLRRALILGVLGGAVLAALLSLLLARRALRPLKRIAATAETIRSGDLSQRIGYRGRDEVGDVANVLDACFAELEEAVERQRRFAADASHELKTPLAAIRANVEQLRGWAGVDTDRRETALASLQESSRRASRLVADLLHLVQLEREPARPRLPIRLDEVVLSAVREATPLRTGVAIRVARLDDVSVLGDPLGLEQVLLNVLDNALEASPEGSEVTVALSASPDRASVTVSDSGAGIDPGERERIFDRFYSKKSAAASRVGAGLGLSIARSITRDHGGELVARECREPGATFELTLPLAVRDADSPPGASEGQAAGSRTTNRPPASLPSA
jgi:signal transduction histidine kinase